MGSGDELPVTFLGRPVGRAFSARVVVIPPGSARRYDEAEWRGALVSVECGQIALECRAGGRRRFAQGALLVLTGLGLVRLHNEHPRERAVLVAVTRRADGDQEPG